MDILEPLSKTSNGNQFLLMMMDCFSKFAIAVPTSKTSASRIASIFMDHLIIQCEFPEYVLTDNVPLVMSMFPEYLRAFLERAPNNSVVSHSD